MDKILGLNKTRSKSGLKTHNLKGTPILSDKTTGLNKTRSRMLENSQLERNSNTSG